MSSLTDIIFLLVDLFHAYFFHGYTNALNLQFARKKSSIPVPGPPPTMVTISADNGFYYNGKAVSLKISKGGSFPEKAKGKDATLNIAPSGQASNESVVAVMDIAYRYEIRAVLSDPQ